MTHRERVIGFIGGLVLAISAPVLAEIVSAAPPAAPSSSAAVSTPTSASPAPMSPSASGKLLVDDFEGSEVANTLGGRSNVFQKAPSKAMVSRRDDTIEGHKTHVLLLRYDKQNEGGPYGMGGWCGWYTLLKKPGHLIAPTEGQPEGAPEQSEEEYLDASAYHAITFWVRGEQGGESFMVGVADQHWDKIGDSVKSEVIGKYLPTGKVTKEWQKAVVPMDAFFVDYAKLSSIAVSFESDALPDGKGAGTIYLDDLTLE